LNNNLIYDIDDAVFMRGKFPAFGVNKLINRASLIFAGNAYLESYCSQFNKNVVVLPTPVNTKLFKPCAIKDELDLFVVGWSGTSSSFNYIAAIEDDLLFFFKSHPSSVFKIVADRFPFELTKLLPYIVFQKWSVESEVQSIQSFSVGIMPIEKNEWARGKCSYKMLLYMSCAIPVVVTDFGMNAEVLNKGKVGIGCWKSRDWSEALFFLFQNKYSLHDLYPDSRRVVQENYSIEVITDVFINSIKRTFKL
jgi:glycosyltransferase involved in cell wall biosynthesis